MQNLDITMLLNHFDVHNHTETNPPRDCHTDNPVHATIEHLVNVVPWTLDEECVRGLTLSVRPQAHGVRAYMSIFSKTNRHPGR